MSWTIRRSRRDVAPGVTPERRSGRDCGNTLVEVVIAVALLALVVAPVLAAVVMTIKASSVARASSNVETAVINAVDRVNRAPSNLCDYLPYAQAAVQTQGWDPSTATVQHAYLDTTGWISGASACPSTGYRKGLIQQVTIRVSDPDDRVSRTIKVVKSNV